MGKTEVALTKSFGAGAAPIWPLQSQCDAYYGDPRPRNVHEAYNVAWAKENLVHISCPWSLTDLEHHFSAIQIHKKAAPSLARVLARVFDEVGRSEAKIHELRYDVFSGSFVYRKKRGAASLSMHAYGAAIDWDAPDNQMRARKHLFTNDSPLIRAFKREGWIWGGDWAGDGVDAMHVQAARVHG
ncbi:MAG: hypothetical protein C3F11_17790 [Methylocystaceae bacterium]|nr:MAG: hypothetical protein C3F11_17790 [Methylocystaceae bacterium]